MNTKNNTKKMTWTYSFAFTIISALAIFSAACSSETVNQSGNKTQSNNPTNQPPIHSKTTADKVPQSLKDAGELGENIYDAAKTADWKTAEAKFNELRAITKKMVDERISLADYEATLGKLEKAVAAKEKTATLIEANQITLEIANLTAKYNPTVPVEVVKLDFYGRELEIWAAEKNEAKLRETAKLIRQNWDAVKAKIEAKGGKKEVAAFENLVLKTDAAKTPADYAKLATPILNEVDNLEQVFN